jgi:hypothetical protein
MGRGFNFSYSKIHLPPTNGDFGETILQLVEGDNVFNLRIQRDELERCPVARCPSNYGYKESFISQDITYVVDSTNFDWRLFEETGLRGVVLRDVLIPIDSHIATWIVTTDGFLRESEEFGIIGQIVSISSD